MTVHWGHSNIIILFAALNNPFQKFKSKAILMSDKPSKGGFNIGNVGGNVSIQAGGDVVAGDKTTTTTIITGFKQEQDKQEFIQQIEELRQQLRHLKSEIEESKGGSLDEDEKDSIVMEVMQHIKALKTASVEAEQLPPQQEPSQEKRDAIEAPLNAVNQIISKISTVFEKTADFGGKFKNVAYITSLLLSARHLFGLP
jgi:TolA-binding protein